MEAKTKIAALRPDKIVCNDCRSDIHVFDAMETKNLPGIDAIFLGICPKCGASTIACKGEDEQVAELLDMWMEQHGGQGRLGVQTKPLTSE